MAPVTLFDEEVKAPTTMVDTVARKVENHKPRPAMTDQKHEH